MASKTTDNIDNICAVCSEVIEIYALGSCDHHVCFKCSTRMRVLCEQTYCSICRTELPKVIFIKKLHRYDYIETHHFLVNRKHKIYFEDENVQTSFYQLLEHKCNECPVSPSLRSFAQLKDHMRKQHSLYYCDICVKHLKIFVHERKYYNRTDLALHRRVGDKDDKSHKGHPLCEFCDERYLDNDELLRHLRKEHYFCHFCDSEGSNQYYSDYNLLKEHFAEKHYLCEEGECHDVQFTNAFRSEIDLKAHIANEHGKSSKRSQVRQARTLDIEINLAPRNVRDKRRERGRGVTTGEDYEEIGGRDNRHRGSAGRGAAAAKKREEINMAMAITASLAEAERQTGAVNVVPPELVQPLISSKGKKTASEQFQQKTEDFPNLDGETAQRDDSEDGTGDSRVSSRSLAQKVAFSSNMSVQDGEMTNEEFPALGMGGKKNNPISQGHYWKESVVSSNKSKGKIVQAVRNARPQSGNMNDFPVLSKLSKPSDIRPNIPGLNYAPADTPVLKSKGKDDFPALSRPVNSSQDVKPKIPGLNFVNDEKSPAHSPQTSRKTSVPKAKAESRVSPPMEDYPALGKPQKSGVFMTNPPPTVKTKATVASTVSETFNKPSGLSSLSQISKSLSTDVSMFQGSFEDFPCLGKPSVSSNVEGKNKKNPKKSGNKKQSSSLPAENKNIKSTVKTLDTEPPKIENTKNVETNVDTNDISTKPSISNSKNNSSEKSPLPSKKNSVNVLKDNDFPSLGKTAPPGVGKVNKNILKDDFPCLGGSKSSSQSNGWIKKPQIEPDKHDDSEAEFVKSKIKSKKKKKGKKSPELQTFADENPFDFIIKDSDKKQTTEKTRKNEKQKMLPAEKNKSMRGEDFPSLLESSKENEVKNQLSTLTADSAVNQDLLAEALRDSSNFLAQQNGLGLQDDFPSLIAGTSAPPPGFNSVLAQKKPPPGFSSSTSAKPQDLLNSVSTPSFTTDAKLTSNVANTTSIGNGSSEMLYLRPPCFQQRNVQLIENIRKLIADDQDKFGKFRTWSGQFRKGLMPAEEYYGHCVQLMGKASFLTIFAELLVLLPDIEKQQQLLRVYNKQPKSVEQRTKKKSEVFKVTDGGSWWNIKGGENFPVCNVCSQVLTPDDYRPHLVEHNIDEEYPSLSNTVTVGNKYGMSAWVKS